MAERIGYDGTLHPQSGGARISSAATGGITPERVGEIAAAQPQWGKVAEEAVKFGQAYADYETKVKDTDYANASLIYGNHVKVLMDKAKQELDAQQDLTDEQYQSRWLLAKADVYQQAAKETNAIVGSKVYDETTGVYKDPSYAIKERKLRDGYSVVMEAGLNEAMFARRKARTENTRALSTAAIVANAPDLATVFRGMSSIVDNDAMLTESQKVATKITTAGQWTKNTINTGRVQWDEAMQSFPTTMQELLTKDDNGGAAKEYVNGLKKANNERLANEKSLIERFYNDSVLEVNMALQKGLITKEEADARTGLLWNSKEELLKDADKAARVGAIKLASEDEEAQAQRMQAILKDIRDAKKNGTTPKIDESAVKMAQFEGIAFNALEDTASIREISPGVYARGDGLLYDSTLAPLLRHDGRTQKTIGWLGEPLIHTDAQGVKHAITELSIGVNIDGEEIEIPAIVPGLNDAEKDYIRQNGEESLKKDNALSRSIIQKAVEHAKRQRADRKSVWAQPKEADTFDTTYYKRFDGESSAEAIVNDAVIAQRLLPEKDPRFFDESLSILKSARDVLYEKRGTPGFKEAEAMFESLKAKIVRNVMNPPKLKQNYGIDATKGLMSSAYAFLNVGTRKDLVDKRGGEFAQTVDDWAAFYGTALDECETPEEYYSLLDRAKKGLPQYLGDAARIREFISAAQFGGFEAAVEKVKRPTTPNTDDGLPFSPAAIAAGEDAELMLLKDPKALSGSSFDSIDEFFGFDPYSRLSATDVARAYGGFVSRFVRNSEAGLVKNDRLFVKNGVLMRRGLFGGEEAVPLREVLSEFRSAEDIDEEFQRADKEYLAAVAEKSSKDAPRADLAKAFQSLSPDERQAAIYKAWESSHGKDGKFGRFKSAPRYLSADKFSEEQLEAILERAKSARGKKREGMAVEKRIAELEAKQKQRNKGK